MSVLAEQSPLAILDDPARAAVLLHPIRQRVLRALTGSDSAAGVGRRLGLPRQQVNYHLRELEQAGLVEEVELRRRGNCMERVLRARALCWAISPDALGVLGMPEPVVRDRFSWATLVLGAARIIRDLGVLRARADGAKKQLPTLTIEAEVRISTPDRLAEFREACANAIGEIAHRFHDDTAPDGRAFRVLLGAYPAITKSDDEARAEAADAALESELSQEIEHGPR